MKELESLSDSLAKKNIARIIPNVKSIEDSPTLHLDFLDGSFVEFEIKLGRQTPRAFGDAKQMANDFNTDLDCISCTKEALTFHFKDKSRMDFNLIEMGANWTKYPRNVGGILKVKILTEESWSATSIFNRNAFASNVGKIVDGCADKSAMLFAHKNSIEYFCEIEKEKFLAVVNGKTTAKFRLDYLKEDSIQLEYNSILLTAAVQGFLVSLKALLDNYAFLLSSSIMLKSANSFGKSKVGGVNISGGLIVNALRKSCPKSYTFGNELSDVIERHSKDWISKTIEYRDQATHHSSISTFENICLIASKNKNNIYELNFLPITINDVEVHIYFNGVLSNLRRFFSETLKYFPNCNKELVNVDNFGKGFIK